MTDFRTQITMKTRSSLKNYDLFDPSDPSCKFNWQWNQVLSSKKILLFYVHVGDNHQMKSYCSGMKRRLKHNTWICITSIRREMTRLRNNSRKI